VGGNIADSGRADGDFNHGKANRQASLGGRGESHFLRITKDPVAKVDALPVQCWRIPPVDGDRQSLRQAEPVTPVGGRVVERNGIDRTVCVVGSDSDDDLAVEASFCDAVTQFLRRSFSQADNVAETFSERVS